jgi:hypothetical protein
MYLSVLVVNVSGLEDEAHEREACQGRQLQLHHLTRGHPARAYAQVGRQQAGLHSDTDKQIDRHFLTDVFYSLKEMGPLIIYCTLIDPYLFINCFNVY